jgi:hypothetical protein
MQAGKHGWRPIVQRAMRPTMMAARRGPYGSELRAAMGGSAGDRDAAGQGSATAESWD